MDVQRRGEFSHLPRIETGYDTPGSDYMSSIRGHPKSVATETNLQTGSTAALKYLRNSASSNGSRSMDSKSQIRNNRPTKHYSSYSKGAQNTNLNTSLDNSKLTTESEKRRFVRDHTVPVAQNTKTNQSVSKSYTDISYARISPLKLTGSATYRKLSSRASFRTPRAWNPPQITAECYESAKNKLTSGGNLKDQMINYFKLETHWWETKSDSEDDGYDTDLDKQLGLELIADEKTREVLKDGAFPEYKQECRKFRSNPNSYFLRHCLDDEMEMRHRYLSKGDSITLSNFTKNHLTFNKLDIEDNSIGPTGMKYFKEVFRENKHLTEMNLSCNDLGSLGAKYLRSSLSGNCFMLKLDISENNIGDKGAKYIAGIIEDNVTLKELRIAGNNIGDTGAALISKALGNNISLKVLDIGWNNIRPVGAVSLCSALKKNTELEVFLATMNGFGEEGGKAMVTVLQQNPVIRELDLSTNRLKDSFIKLLTKSLDEITNLSVLNVANNPFTSKVAADCLALVMAEPASFIEINFEGIEVADDFRGLSNALHVVHNVTVLYNESPSKRDVTSDILTRNLKHLCEFMEEEEIEVEDLFPDYDEDEEEEPAMITTKEALCALEFCGKVTNKEKLQRLKANLRYGRRRKFLISELGLVYDTVICGKDPLQEQPLRTHLRRSITEERKAIERRAKMKKKRSVFS